MSWNGLFQYFLVLVIVAFWGEQVQSCPVAIRPEERKQNTSVGKEPKLLSQESRGEIVRSI